MSSSIIENNDDYYLLKLVENFIDFGFIFFPSIGFIHQYIKIKNIRSSLGFSKLVSLILLLAYMLRIYFWMGKRFGLVLLFQSIVGIITQLLLLQVSVEYSTKAILEKESDLFSLKHFWNWPLYSDYLMIILFLTTIFGSISNFIGYNNLIYVEIIGSISAMIESVLGLPQVLENYFTKDVKALSYIMILCWFLGDSIKIFYYVKTSSPVQLVICGCIQLFCDIVIIAQIYYYTKMYSKKSLATI